ncbi:type II secretion system protein E [Desulforamulus reducens MI-1]|uniref:Type II secretion system protein E n=1 Tax=Desulforamulus reducens (strain ATCC BAA-1160 / DSM 100696 / MI-1) TaxID=349161 RepID=A4J6D0_DESRM|nr:CpaF family protein [Desulforamulus reducens]ABO50633.1 type II secretion system protein E [Desulforamulus reducens MI-1]
MSLLQRLEKQKSLQPDHTQQVEIALARRDRRLQGKAPLQELTLTLHKKVIDKLKDIPEDVKDHPETLAKKIETLVNDLLDEGEENVARPQRQMIVAEIIDETIGFGPITTLLNDPSISEVMVNGPDQIYVERDGKLILTGVNFRDNAHVLHIIDKIVAPIGRRIDESMPMVDARLPDGSRVNAIIPPLALNGPTITIRKFSKDPYTVDDLINFGTLTPQMAQFVEACVKARLNIVVSGGTGSGKTTTLNVLSSFIPPDERIVTIEDAAELQLRQEHVITLESRPPNIEGKGAITIRDLVRNSLRMRPERIVVGEVRSGEALDMLQAMNTGHDGSLTTGHANTPRDMLSRLETMVLMAGMDLPIRAIREQISSAIDLIIQQSRLKDGSRKITHITEVQGMEGEVIILQDLFVFHQTGLDENGKVKGTFHSTGIRPKFTSQLETIGIKLPPGLFSPSLF